IGQYYLPTWNLKIVPFMIVGMGAFFAGVARAPFAAMIMVSDIIGSYTLIPPLMIVSMIALVLSHRWSIYVAQLKNRFLSPAHFWDMQLDVLNQLKIGESFDQYRRNAIVSRNTLFHELESLAVNLHASDFVVTDSAGVYQGMVSLKNVRLTSEMATIRNLVTVGDVTDGSVLAASPQASLGQALKIITENEYDKVAVVDPNTHRILGYIRYHDIFTVYHRHLNQPTTEQLTGQASESRSE
ncbi:MAG: chloride channel protein, partial [Leptospiraceae bacterium]|nr:chloride channel protein [Leptospiraceae bacterium]